MKYQSKKATRSTLALVGLATMLVFPSAISVAQSVDEGEEITNRSFESAAINDLEQALSALKNGDYQKASTYLQFASAQTDRLKLRKIAAKFASADVGVNFDDIKYAINDSAILNLENFASLDNAFETSHTDEKGRVVTIRVLSNGTALDSFMRLSGDKTQLETVNLESVVMAGEPAIKKRGHDGSLSVVMMSESDHALIEIEGQDEDAVMALVEKQEKGEE
ncbi:MAG: hypothetical protein AAGH42_08535 [Pseudomonadota bacterium]